MPPQRGIPTTLGRPPAGRVAVRFMAACVIAGGLAAGIAGALFWWAPPSPRVKEVAFPPVFWMTTGLLAAGSLFMHRAAMWVRRERQSAFRRSLLLALAAGVLFVGIQTYGILELIRNQQPEAAQLGVNAFATAMTGLHAMHFTLAMMLLIWVTLQARDDRYDHEYYWEVTVCGWFWHALGIVWMAILAVFALAA